MWNMPLRVFMEISMELMIICVTTFQQPHSELYDMLMAVAMMSVCVVMYIVLVVLTLSN